MNQRDVLYFQKQVVWLKISHFIYFRRPFIVHDIIQYLQSARKLLLVLLLLLPVVVCGIDK